MRVPTAFICMHLMVCLDNRVGGSRSGSAVARQDIRSNGRLHNKAEDQAVPWPCRPRVWVPHLEAGRAIPSRTRITSRMMASWRPSMLHTFVRLARFCGMLGKAANRESY